MGCSLPLHSNGRDWRRLEIREYLHSFSTERKKQEIRNSCSTYPQLAQEYPGAFRRSLLGCYHPEMGQRLETSQPQPFYYNNKVCCFEVGFLTRKKNTTNAIWMKAMDTSMKEASHVPPEMYPT